MTTHHNTANRFSSRPLCLMRGQASIEYIVVLAFSVILLTKAYTFDDPATGTKTMQPAITQLKNALTDYQTRYSDTMDIAYIPDCQYTTTDLIGHPPDIATNMLPSFTADVCPDWTNPQMPLDFESMPDLSSLNVSSMKSYIDGKVSDALDPSNITHAISPPSGLSDWASIINPF